jgi:hypothetical protein
MVRISFLIPHIKGAAYFATERVALEALYNATGGKHWSDSPSNGWLIDPCQCNWVGVICTTSAGPGECWQAYTPDYYNYPTCSGYAGVGYTCVGDYCSAIGPQGTPGSCAKFVPRADAVDPLTGKCTGTSGPANRKCHEGPVSRIDRQSGKNLTGVLPSWNGDPGQGALPQLQELLITNNPGLTGTLPESYGDMEEINYLNLANNNLEGPLPKAWDKMTKMQNLDLYVKEKKEFIQVYREVRDFLCSNPPPLPPLPSTEGTTTKSKVRSPKLTQR